MNQKEYVFISYSSKDDLFVQKMVETMQNSGISYWKAPEMIPAGSNYAKEIPRAIKECAIFLLVLSGTAQKSIWIEKEIDLAVCHRKTIIPVQIDREPLNDMYRFYLNNVQMISVLDGKNLEPDFSELRERIQKLFAKNLSQENAGNLEKAVRTNERTSQNAAQRSNALRINRIPHECEFCGGEVERDSMGVYVCLKCGRENYDDFQKVRNYLEKAGAAPAVVIARNTGVPLKTIEYFWKEEFLEIPKTVDIRMACRNCGAPIRTGDLCEVCKRASEKSMNQYSKGSWHSEIWKR